ncbi:MAG: DUF4160 domain-containing protein [Candidatus Melainabacteria bacterium]|jgi:hypothetical protein
MPTISIFFGIVITLYFFDSGKHNTPHIHAKYQENEAVFEIETAEMIDGNLPKNKIHLVKAWIEIHKEDLMADWDLASRGQPIFKIDPLR